MIKTAANDLIQFLRVQRQSLVHEHPLKLKGIDRFIEFIPSLDLSNEKDIYVLFWELKCFLNDQPKMPSSYWEKEIVSGKLPLYGSYGSVPVLLPKLIELTVKYSRISTYHVEFPGYFMATRLLPVDSGYSEHDKEITISNGYEFASHQKDIAVLVSKPDLYDVKRTYSTVAQKEFQFDDIYVIKWNLIYKLLGIDKKIYYQQINQFGDNWLGRHEAIIKETRPDVKFHSGMMVLKAGSSLFKEFNKFLIKEGYQEV